MKAVPKKQPKVVSTVMVVREVWVWRQMEVP